MEADLRFRQEVISEMPSSFFDEKAGSSEQTAQSMQAAYSVMATHTGNAAGAATGAAISGPLGAAAGLLASGKVFWKVIAAIIAAIFLWMFLIANMIGIIFTYLGFMSADDYANEAQTTEFSMVKKAVESILSDDSYSEELTGMIEKQRDEKLAEINQDAHEKYPGSELAVVDEYKTKLKVNLAHYLAVLMLEDSDRATVNSFLGHIMYGNIRTTLSSPYNSYFHEAAVTYNVPEALLLAMGMVESGYNPNAVSPAGAVGIMQLMPATAASLGVTDSYDPRQNIMGGAKYISMAMEMFKAYPNALELVIAAYNAGPQAVINAGYQVPHYRETQNHVAKVMSYLIIEEGTPQGPADKDAEGKFQILKNLVEENAAKFFDWSVTDEKEYDVMMPKYYLHTEAASVEIGRETYERLKSEKENVTVEMVERKQREVEYTLALLLNSQVQGSAAGYSYKYVTNRGIFETVLRVLQLMTDGASSIKDSLFTLFSWTDFITGGKTGDSYYGNIDATGDIITYNTVGACVKQVVYFNQGEEPWGSMPYGPSTIGYAGCGPTSLAIVISTLTGQNVNPQMTSAYAINNGEYMPGAGTSHSFPTNAAHHWGLTCERVGKNMEYVMSALKQGKMVVEICEAYTITGGSSGHFIVLTGVTADGYITIADCGSRERSAKVYNPETIRSYGRDLADGCFWIIGR